MKSTLLCLFLIVAPALLRAETTAPETSSAPASSSGNSTTSNAPPSGSAKSTTPTVVTSDQFKLDMGNHQGLFTGNVIMVGIDYKMKSREMYVYFDDKNQIKRMVSRGDVEIEQPNRQSKSGQAEYFTDDNKIILTESPQVVENQKTVSGATITMYRNNNKMDVDGHSRVLIYQEDAPKPAADAAK